MKWKELVEGSRYSLRLEALLQLFIVRQEQQSPCQETKTQGVSSFSKQTDDLALELKE